MALDYRTLNLLWGSILVETLARLGLRQAVICPGSRSTPLTLALAHHPQIATVPVLDERSAAFLALGLAKRSGQPIPVVCSSGTAGANFYPALIEAKESQVPLLLLTADRPPELRDCSSGQTIDQIKLFGTYPNWQLELMLPSADPEHLAYLRQRTYQAWQRCLWPIPGPVHVNLPFRDPLAPPPDGDLNPGLAALEESHFFSHLTPTSFPRRQPFSLPWSTWSSTSEGLIIAGPAQPPDPFTYCQSVAQLSQILGWPVLAEGLSPLRNHAPLNPNLITTYDLLLRHPGWAQRLQPTQILQLGPLPTSKVLRSWLQQTQAPTWVIDPSGRDRDPLHRQTIWLPTSVEDLLPVLKSMAHPPSSWASAEERHIDPAIATPDPSQTSSAYRQAWLRGETQGRQLIDHTLRETQTWIESKIPWLLPQILPPDTPLFIANSLPVRDVEWVWPPNPHRIHPFFNRGANGIDGTLSTALGIAHSHHSPATVLLTGDLALLHDTNGLLFRPHLQGHLTVLLINNQGGGIFELLPISQFDPPFETFFATPQSVEIPSLCQAYGIEYERIQTWSQLRACLNPLPQTGIRVLEVQTDRKHNARWRQHQFQTWSTQLSQDLPEITSPPQTHHP